MDANRPWTLPASEVEIVQSFESEVVGEEGDDLAIAFHDKDGGRVEAHIPKSEFRFFPEEAKPPIGGEAGCAHFGIVVFRLQGEAGVRCSSWPLMRHWHPSWQSYKECEGPE
jgi:hypothetical protein